jgi:hypothetical protein
MVLALIHKSIIMVAGYAIDKETSIVGYLIASLPVSKLEKHD